MDPRCEQARPQLERFLDGELSGRRRAEVERHLTGCPDCQAELSLLRVGGALLREDARAAAAAAPMDRFSDSVLRRVKQEQPLSAGERLRTWLGEFLFHRRVVLATGLAAVAFAVAVLVPLLSSGPIPGGAGPGGARPDGLQPDAVQTAGVDNEVIIDRMEYAGDRSMIFTVSKNNTTVIWLYDMKALSQQKSQGDDL
jgi:anti-sigma factor RsiW